MPFFGADLAVFFSAPIERRATAEPVRQMCVYAFKKRECSKRDERRERERAEGEKEQCSFFVLFEIQEPGGKAAKRTSDKSGYQWQQHW